MRTKPAWSLSMCLLLLGAPGIGCGPTIFPWTLKADHRPATQSAAEVSTEGPYDRTRSGVLVRKISRPTRANLDYAAYHANVVTADPGDEVPVDLAGDVPAESDLFGGVLVPGTIVASLDQTPLTTEEKARPMAFSPLVDFLLQWDYAKASMLDDARAAVRTESWGRPKNVQITYQQITEVHLHADKELWVKIEFQPWARLFADMPDADADGYPQIYARLKTETLPTEVLDHIRGEYAGRVLNEDGVRAWANELASYWYPSYNTDVYDLGDNTVWPIEETEPEITKALGGRGIENPTVVIRGKPHGKPVYNVFVVDGMGPLGKKAPSATGKAAVTKRGKETVTPDLETQKKALAAELERRGSWKRWVASVRRYHDQIRGMIRNRPRKLKALIGKDGFLFFRNSLDYVVGGDLQKQPEGKNPFPAIVDFKNYLAELGVDFLLVPIPTKVEVFPGKVVAERIRLDDLPVLNPYGRKLLGELTEAGVEVVDLLPAFLEARARRGPGDEPLYQPQDTHWTDRGLRLAARLVAERIRRYPWYPELAKNPVEFTEKRVEFKQQGDLVSRLADREQPRFKPDSLVGHQVLFPDGKLYEDDLESPIVILGDSFTGVFQRTYCRGAGVSAHIAKEIRYPVDLVMSYGGGPNVRRTLLRRGEDDLRKRRLVVWMFAARDLYNYWEDWELMKR